MLFELLIQQATAQRLILLNLTDSNSLNNDYYPEAVML